MKKDFKKLMTTLFKNSTFRIGVILFFAVIFAGSALWYYYMLRLPPGLYMGSYKIGLMTFTELIEILDELQNRLNCEEVKIIIEKNKEESFLLSDLGIKLDKEKIIKSVKEHCNTISFLDRIMQYQSKKIIKIDFKAERIHFEKKLDEINSRFKKCPRNARVRAQRGEIVFIPHKNGVELATEKMFSQLLNELSKWPEKSLKLEVKLQHVLPEKSMSNIILKGIREEISSKQTLFDPSAENRVHNIKLAVEKIDAFMIVPGEVFSFNEIVGETSLADGFKEAPVIIDDQLVPAAGGGVCQVSSTLYNAALLAGLEIKERHNHGLTVNYLPPGYDAAVAYDYLDLKFKNDKPYNILIHMWVLRDKLNAKLFGTDNNSLEILLIDNIIEIISPPVKYITEKDKPSGYREIQQWGKPGYIVETIRVFYENEKERDREYISKDYYAPKPEIIVVGPSA